jgi:hypothetical protein
MRKSEQGSVFFYILIGIVLFAAVTFAVNNMMRASSGQFNISTQEEMRIALSEVRQVVEEHKKTIQQIILNGYPVDSISAYDSTYYPYANTDCTVDNCKMYVVASNGISWYRFTLIHTGLTDVPNVTAQSPSFPNGVYWTWYADQGSTWPDLIYAIRIKKDFCNFINTTIGVTTDIDSTDNISLDIHALLTSGMRTSLGTLSHSAALTSVGEGGHLLHKPDGCIRKGAVYYYVAILYAT